MTNKLPTTFNPDKKEKSVRKLIVFNQVSLDGYFVDAAGDMSWAHKNDPEWNAFASENASGGGELVFGRITYEMMASFWPTPQATQIMPAVAKGMNQSPKIVFSRTLDRASWNNTRLIKGDIVAQMRELKKETGPGMVILGSGSIVSQLAQAGLIDEYQIVTNPIVLGGGRTMFAGVKQKLQLKLANSRTFKNGNVLLHYESAA
jgi:dihydrofolate reductase